jgi:hypothetical protein
MERMPATPIAGSTACPCAMRNRVTMSADPFVSRRWYRAPPRGAFTVLYAARRIRDA